MNLRQKPSEVLKDQIQDFLAISPYAQQLQVLLSLSEEKLHDSDTIQKFLEQQHLDPEIWTAYIDHIKVKSLLEHNQYFAKLDLFWKDDFLKLNFDLLAFFDQHGFLGRDIFQTCKFLKNIQAGTFQKDELLQKLQFFTSKNILTPRNIYFFPIDLFYLSTSVIEYLEKLSFFDNNPFFDEKRYLDYEGFVFQQYLLLFCTGKDTSSLRTYETLNPMIDYYSPDFSEKLLRLIEVAKKEKPKDWISFFGLMQLIIAEDNYKDLLVTLQQKLSLGNESDILLLLESWKKRISEFLNMDKQTFISLIDKIESLGKSIQEALLKEILLEVFKHNNYFEILSSLFKILSIMSWTSFSYYYTLQNNSFTHLWMNYTEDNLPYIQTLEKLKNSKVPELQYSPESFLSFILESSDPLEALNVLETVYSSSHLPQLVKNFSLFRLLYDDKKLGQLILSEETVSPYLKGISAQERIPALYKDFLTIAINSNEASLKNLITQIVSWLPLLKRFEKWLQELKQKERSNNLNLTFSPEEQSQLFHLFERLEVLPFLISPEEIQPHAFKKISFSHDQLEAYYHHLLRSLKVPEWTSFADACDQSFARWGYPQLTDLLSTMDQATQSAMTTNTQKLENTLTFGDWDFLKGVEKPETILQILQTGILSREYIGARGANSDSTPFDTDFEELTKREENQSLSDYLKTTYAVGMGSYLILIKNPDQLFSKEKGYEKIIHNNEGHRGIRTGLPITEISALIMPEEVKSEELDVFKYQIAKNGFYLPIYDRNGKLLFTLEDYAQLRKGFVFSPRYGGYLLDSHHKVKKQQDPDLKTLSPQFGFEQSSDEAESLANFTAKKIQTYLKELGIFVSLEDRKSTQEASLLNIGSTGRGTATDLSAQDQDFVLILPPQYADQKESIVAHLHNKIQTSQKAENEGPRENGAYQLRSEINQLGKNWSSLPFDLLIMENIHGVQLSSAQAMQERLEHILQIQGKVAYDAVLSNIRAAKSLLAQHHIYKRTEGGLGWIGVEHWILQNEWSLEKALESLEKVAYQGKYQKGKKSLPLEEFQKHYPLYDTGYNRKNGTIDNYILKLNEESYKKLLQLCKEFIEKDKIN